MTRTRRPDHDDLIAAALPAIQRLAAGTHTDDDAIAINLADITIRGNQDRGTPEHGPHRKH